MLVNTLKINAKLKSVEAGYVMKEHFLKALSELKNWPHDSRRKLDSMHSFLKEKGVRSSLTEVENLVEGTAFTFLKSPLHWLKIKTEPYPWNWNLNIKTSSLDRVEIQCEKGAEKVAPEVMLQSLANLCIQNLLARHQNLDAFHFHCRKVHLEILSESLAGLTAECGWVAPEREKVFFHLRRDGKADVSFTVTFKVGERWVAQLSQEVSLVRIERQKLAAPSS